VTRACLGLRFLPPSLPRVRSRSVASLQARDRAISLRLLPRKRPLGSLAKNSCQVLLPVSAGLPRKACWTSRRFWQTLHPGQLWFPRRPGRYKWAWRRCSSRGLAPRFCALSARCATPQDLLRRVQLARLRHMDNGPVAVFPLLGGGERFPGRRPGHPSWSGRFPPWWRTMARPR
jgi:hypothetical protein